MPDPLIFIIYATVLTSLILYSGFFGLLNDNEISRKQITLLFLGKLLAVPVFLFVYTKIYGGINDFDTGKFYHDVKVISNYGKTDFFFLFRLLIGLQDDNPGSYDYENVLKNTLNWDNGTVKDYLYNDNRVLIRIHVLLNFIAWNSYSVHALLNCFLSFLGVFFFYKTFKEWFSNKEFQLLLILCFFPSLWFYTGALLKEGITFFVLGCTLYQIKKVIYRNYKPLNLIWLAVLLLLSFLLKPYLLTFSVVTFTLFFFVYRSGKIRRKILLFFSAMVSLIVLANTASVIFKQRSLLEAALKQQRRFVGVSKGGIFLSDSLNFIRLKNDTTQLKRVLGKKNEFTIRKNVDYIYWTTEDQKDTLYCQQNLDTLTKYQLVYIIQPGKSNIELPYSNSLLTVGACYYYTLFYPTLFTAKNSLQYLASFENLVIFTAFIVILIGLIKNKKGNFLPITFVFFALSLCLLIGLTSPNSGAIFRYRSPAMAFLLLAALYYSDEIKRLIQKN